MAEIAASPRRKLRRFSTPRSCQLRTIIQIAVETGMRRNELASLIWNEIDLKKQTAHLPKTKTDVPRTVPLSKVAVKALKAFGIKNEGPVSN